jgi:hypothetical protein
VGRSERTPARLPTTVLFNTWAPGCEGNDGFRRPRSASR